jgi:hypothetical protein
MVRWRANDEAGCPVVALRRLSAHGRQLELFRLLIVDWSAIAELVLRRARNSIGALYQRARKTRASLLSKLPSDLLASEEARMLSSIADEKVYSLVHLIYRSKHYEGRSKDHEFSRISMEEHRRAGYHDAVPTLRHPETLQPPSNQEGVSRWAGIARWVHELLVSLAPKLRDIFVGKP